MLYYIILYNIIQDYITLCEHSLFVLQGAPSFRVRQRPVQRSLTAAQAHHRALSSPSNPGTVPPSPRLPGGGGGGGGRRAGSAEEEPGGEEETGESPEELGRDAGSERDINTHDGGEEKVEMELLRI